MEKAEESSGGADKPDSDDEFHEEFTETVTHGGRYVLYTIGSDNQQFEVYRKYFPPICRLGRGSYGTVLKALNSETGEKVAIKKISMALDKPDAVKKALREVIILCRLDHENVIAVKDIIRPPQKDHFNDVYIVYAMMETDLHKAIIKDRTFSDYLIQILMCQLLRGLKYVHSANVLHRDLKPSNLLINTIDWKLKIGDFGLARSTAELDLMTAEVVTLRYRAPELLLCTQKYTDYTAAIDIWSVGCILGDLLIGLPLFPGTSPSQQIRLMTQLIGSPDGSSLHLLRSKYALKFMKELPHYPRQKFSAKFPNASPMAVDLLEKMLVFDPSKRITADQALSHPYLKDLHDKVSETVCDQPLPSDFEERSVTDMKDLIWNESVRFNPNP